MRYTEDSQIAKDANYTLSVVDSLRVIDEELSSGRLVSWCNSDHDSRFEWETNIIPMIDWNRIVTAVLPVELQYIADAKLREV